VPPLEVAEEFLPLLFGGGAVLLSGAQGAAAGDERPVVVDDLLWVNGLIAHRGVDIAVAGHELGDVRRHPVHDRVGDEQTTAPRFSTQMALSGPSYRASGPVPVVLAEDGAAVAARDDAAGE
jgi:hypothetical protein